MDTIIMWAELSPSAATNARSKNAPDTLVRNAILSTGDIAKIKKDAENAIGNSILKLGTDGRQIFGVLSQVPTAYEGCNSLE